MEFVPDRVAFGRHESFPLRFGWLTKGFQAFQKDPNIFAKDEAIIELGVGRNMVHAIRYWLRATGMLGMKANQLSTTDLGERLFSAESGWDPYLEDEATIWLLHWQLASYPQEATTFFWFFNRFHRTEFAAAEATTALLDFAMENITTRSSTATLKKDVAVILRMYVQTVDKGKAIVDEALDSPLSLLKLITYSPATKIYFSRYEDHRDVPLGIFGYAIAELFSNYGASEIPIEELMYSKDGRVAPGSIFRLSEQGLLTRLEQLVNYLPGVFEIRESAGIHQLYKLEDVKSFEYLEEHYKAWTQGKAT